MPTLYGVPLDTLGQPERDMSQRDSVTERDEWGVGGEASGRPEIVEQSPSGLPDADPEEDRDNVTERDRRDMQRDKQRDVTCDSERACSSVHTAGAEENEEYPPVEKSFASTVNGTLQRDDSVTNVTRVTRDLQRDRDLSHAVTLMPNERRLLNRVERLERTVEETRTLLALALGRSDGAIQVLVKLAERVGLEPPVGQVPTEPGHAEDALEALRRLVLPQIEPSTGTLRPLDADEVLRAHRSADSTVDELLAPDAPEPQLEHALVAGYQLLMFQFGLAALDDLSLPLSLEARVSLEEAHRSAAALVMSPDAQQAFALFMCWVELYARDQMVPRSKKSPADFVIRIAQYVTAVVPEEAARWTPRKVVAAWQRATGAPVTAPSEEMQ